MLAGKCPLAFNLVLKVDRLSVVFFAVWCLFGSNLPGATFSRKDLCQIFGRGSKIGAQNGALVSGMRSPEAGGWKWQVGFVPTWEPASPRNFVGCSLQPFLQNPSRAVLLE